MQFTHLNGTSDGNRTHKTPAWKAGDYDQFVYRGIWTLTLSLMLHALKSANFVIKSIVKYQYQAFNHLMFILYAKNIFRKRIRVFYLPRQPIRELNKQYLIIQHSIIFSIFRYNILKYLHNIESHVKKKIIDNYILSSKYIT